MQGRLLISLVFSSLAAAEQPSFATGPVIQDFGQHVKVENMLPLPQDAQFKIAFDVAEQAEPGTQNKRFNSLARFINMHVANGVKPQNIQLALVVHGKAGFDLLNDASYRQKFSHHNANAGLIKALAAQGVQVMLCGQSAGAMNLSAEHLMPEVTLGLSAMTLHALLQQQGYTLNPF
ncbi:DsrE family protein [Bowmanella pacifica]|uniref:DsrE/DsrF-like family protein n=1 Tax=Bowmanella pacifica TaxID=502051 RepID=A0A917YX41_9ALTE|nr:DsrE family protein [Bowmanella pacifica]GGO68737.1 hypothetical protein GCM10010982_18350 [Bowmanella pacifica]